MNSDICACFVCENGKQEEGNFRGLLIRRDAEVLHIIVGQNYYVEIKPRQDSSSRIAITKQQDTYSVYVDGIPVAEGIVSSCEPYTGTLLIGAQETSEHEKFRYSAVTVNRLEVRDEVLTLSEIQQW